MRNHVQLITYADRLAGSLRGVGEVLRTDFATAFGGVHVLPFFTPFDGADAGFDPVDHTRVDVRLGSWDDVREIASTHQVMADLIVNHVSSDSAQFRDVVARGSASPWVPLFLTMGSVFTDGATEQDLTSIYRPRPGLPFTPVRFGAELRYAWTTFTSQQMDIDVQTDIGRDYLMSVLDAVTSGGVTAVRLDAVGYAVKTPGTSCFMTPETFDFIADFAAKARDRGAEVLVEVHSHYQRQIEIARKVDLVYDFALPGLALHAFFSADGEPLLKWLKIRPENAVTVLDTHDGIGVIDVGPDPELGPGLLSGDQVHALVETIHERTHGASRLATGAAASNLDLYQVNSTFFDALGADDTVYLAARTLQFFTPGVPQVYYVGALAGHNDLELLERSGVGRDINRHVYSRTELDEQLQRPVVRSLLGLCRFRNTHPAFDGGVQADLDGSVLTLTRRGVEEPEAWATARIDLADGATTISWGDSTHPAQDADVAGLPF